MSSLRNAYHRVAPNEQSILLRNATIDGDPAGDADANVTGTLIAPIDFFIAPLATQRFEIVQATIEVSDGGNPSIDDYGSITGPLANGVQFFIEQQTVQVPFGNPVKTNRELINLGPITQAIQFAGSIQVRTYTFNVWEHAREGVFIDGDVGGRFGIKIQDDLAMLVNHTITFKGNIQVKVAS